MERHIIMGLQKKLQRLLLRTPLVLNAGSFSNLLRKSIYTTGTVNRVKKEISENEKKLLKPTSEMPGPKVLPFIGTEWIYTMFGPYTQDNMHHVGREDLYYKYGPIYKEILGGQTIVSLYKNEHIETVFRNEGPHPMRQINEANVYWRRKNQHKYGTIGLLDTHGEEWYELRKLTSESILKNDAGPIFTERLSKTADEFITLLKSEIGPDGYIADIRPYLYRLGLESMWRSMFGKELGALKMNPPAVATALIKHTIDLMTSFADLSLSKPHWKKCPAASLKFRKFSKADSNLYDIIVPYSKLIEEQLTDDQINSEDYSYLTRFLRHPNFKRNFLSTMVVDFVAAGIPSTSYFTSMILHKVAQEEKLQKRIQTLVDKVLPTENTLITEEIYREKLRLLKYTIKEGGRLTTTIPAISRILPVDIRIDDYLIPAKTSILVQTRVACRLECNFWKPLEFIPDRWMHRYPAECAYDDKHLEIFKKDARQSNFLVLPFGHGKRACVGRALAEREIAITLSKILRSFDMKSVGELALGNLFLLAPVKPVSLWLKPRSTMKQTSTSVE